MNRSLREDPVGQRVIEPRPDAHAGLVPEIVEGVGDDGAPGPDNRHLVTEQFHLAHDVAAQQDRAALGGDLPDRFHETAFHHWVQAGGRLVQQQQGGPGRQSRDQGHLLPVALGITTDPAPGIELETLD